MRITERYTTAVSSTNLLSEERTLYSDTDVLGAMGIAAKTHPLGTALSRMLVDGKAEKALDLLAGLAFGRARLHKVTMGMPEARDVAMATLGWFRHGKCRECCGTGFRLVADEAQTRSDELCGHCGGTGKIPFAEQFNETPTFLPVALWLAAQIDREISWAHAQAAQKIGKEMDL